MNNTQLPKTSGLSRRKILLTAQNPQTVTVWLEDDFHHFGLSVEHDGVHVVSVKALAKRHPYTTCQGAIEPIKSLVGTKLFARASEVGKYINMRLQCTHLFDLAGLAISHIVSGRQSRLYEALVTDREINSIGEDSRRVLGAGKAELYVDGDTVLSWEIDRQEITAPPDTAGQSLRDGFRHWTENMELERAEYATILRRAIMIAGGRSATRFKIPLPGQRNLPQVCHTFQKSVRDDAQWINDSVVNWEKDGQKMLSFAEQGLAAFDADK